MNLKPKYLLKYLEVEIEDDSLEELMRLAKNLTVYWEVFRVYKSGLQEKKTVLTIDNIEKVINLKKRGYNFKSIKRQTGLSEFWIGKIVGKNSIVEI